MSNSPLGFPLPQGPNQRIDNPFLIRKLPSAKTVKISRFHQKTCISPIFPAISLKIIKRSPLGNPRDPKEPQEIPTKSQPNPSQSSASPPLATKNSTNLIKPK
jgi:hypothetical protein